MNEQIVSEVADFGDSTPRTVTLLGNHPNPFNPSTEISFELSSPQAVDLQIFSSRGRLVRTLLSGVRDAGVHHIVWDGRDASGHHSPSGIYFYRIHHEGGAVTGKMALTK